MLKEMILGKTAGTGGTAIHNVCSCLFRMLKDERMRDNGDI